MKPAILFLGLAATTFAADFRPNLGPDLPRITVTCGDVTLLLRQASQWTPGRIDFRGVPLTTERSAYGTVFSFPGTGFIGTAHLENEPEDLRSLDFFLDGKRLENPGSDLAGDSFRLDRVSRIRGFTLTSVVELRDNRLHETTTVRSSDAIPLKLVYHFMHAWTPTVSAFLAGRDGQDTPVVAGSFSDAPEAARKFHINEPIDWVAVFDPESGRFAVSRLVAVPESGGHVSTIWNVPGTYRKYYLRCFQDETVPAGFTGTWQMVTGFGTVNRESWMAEAQALAEKLRTDIKAPLAPIQTTD